MRSVCFVVLPDSRVVGAVGTEFFPCQTDNANGAGAASEEAACSVLPADMTFRRLRAKVLGSGFASGESATITLRYSTDEGATWTDSALSVTVDDAVTEDSEDAVEVALSEGDLVTWKVVRAGGIAGLDQTVWGCEIVCSAGQPVFAHSQTTRSATTELLPDAWRQSGGTSYYFQVGADATLGGLRAWCSAAPGGAASWDLDVFGRVDAAWSDTSFSALGFSASIGSAQQSAVDPTTTYALLRGHAVYFRLVPSGGTPAAAYLAMSAVLLPDAPGRSTYSWRYSGNDAVTTFMTAGLGGNQSVNSSEPRRQQLIPSDDWSVRDAFLVTQNYASSPGIGNERGIDLRVDGGAGNTTLLLSGTEVFAEDTTHTDELGTGQLIAWQWTIGTSGLSDDLGSVRAGFVLEDLLAGGGPADFTATATGAIAGRAAASGKGAMAAGADGAMSGAVAAGALGAIVARAAGSVSSAASAVARGAVQAATAASAIGRVTPTSRVAVVAHSAGAIAAVVLFEPAGEFAAVGSAIASCSVAIGALGSVEVQAAASLRSTAIGTITGALSGTGLATSRGSATSRACVAARATHTASLASSVDLRAFGELRATVALELVAQVTVTAGVPVVLHPLPGLGVLVATWQPSLVRTWREHLSRTVVPMLGPTCYPDLDATLRAHLEEVP